jgi:hypothetical protein
VIILPGDASIPKGFVELPGEYARVYTNGKEIVYVGTPPEEEEDPNCEIHDCDAMGCNWEHVIFRAKPKFKLDRLGLKFLYNKAVESEGR